MKINRLVPGVWITASPIFLVLAASIAPPAFGSPIVNLNSAITFGFLGGTLSDTGTSQIVGNVGATVTSTGFVGGPATATGTIYSSDLPVVQNAYNDFENAWALAEALAPTQPLLSSLSSGQTFLGNNVYGFTTPAVTSATGTNLLFDAQGNPNAVFVIQIQGAFQVNGVITFTLENGANADNIFWIIGTPSLGAAATISVADNPPITFDGNILAGGTGGTFNMSASGEPGGSGVLAGTINGCVFTNAGNTLSGETDINGCAASTAATGTTPEPGSSLLVALGCLVGGLGLRRYCKSPPM